MDFNNYNKIYKYSNNCKSIDISTIKHLLLKPDPLIERHNINLKHPIFYKNLNYIYLEKFNYNKNINFEQNFYLSDKQNYIEKENDILIDLYINSYKMQKCLIYCKEPPNNENKYTLNNFIKINYKNISNNQENNNNLETNEFNQMNLIKKANFDSKKTLIFESKFESGNLQLAYLVDSENYDKYQLFLHNDTNTLGYTQWFFYRVTNTQKNKKVNFKIMNCLRKSTKYCYGVKIYVYSKKLNTEKEISWHHTNENVLYYKNNLYKIQNKKRFDFYTLSFDYTFKYNDDEIFFANCIPYTYTDLNLNLNFFTKFENTKYQFFYRKKLCNTLSGNDVEYLIINSNIPNKKTTIKKNGIVIIARQHPSETVGSFVMQGILEFIMNESKEANYLRENYLFKIIPMINVDGVIAGNTRTSYSGCDLNRRWENPDEYYHPEIFYAKKMIKNFSSLNKIDFIFDLHGHFGAFNSFFYCNKEKDNFSFSKMFPFFVCNKSKIIDFSKCKFSMEKFKKSTGRINLYNELNIENIFTLETSNFGCINKFYKNKYFSINMLKEIGIDLCMGILYYHYNYNLSNNFEFIIINKKFSKINLNEIKEKYEEDIKKINKDFNDFINKNNINDNFNNKDENNIINPSDNDLNSESNPSGDNLELNELKKLIPKKEKKKKKFITNKKIRLFSGNYKNYSKKYERCLKYQTSLNNSNSTNNNNNNNNNNLNINNENLSNKRNHFLPILKKSNSYKKEKNKTKLNINISQKILEMKPLIPKNIFENNYNSSNINNNNNDNKNKKNKLKTSYTIFKTISYKKFISPQKTHNINNFENDKNIIININVINQEKKISKKDNFTQTEKIFFEKHWSYFIGTYPILYSNIEEIDFKKYDNSLNKKIFIEKFGKKKIIFTKKNLINIEKNFSKLKDYPIVNKINSFIDKTISNKSNTIYNNNTNFDKKFISEQISRNNSNIKLMKIKLKNRKFSKYLKNINNKKDKIYKKIMLEGYSD